MPKAFHSARYQQFRECLIERRRRAALTQTDLADRLGRPQSYVAKYETGERRLDVIEFLEIADAAGFDAAEVLRELQSIAPRSRRR
jgi:transcriptional regulator with XRE-family HTH domain